MSVNYDQQKQEQPVRSNKFEQPHDQRNDLIDSGVAFIVSFGFFMTVFAIFVLFEIISQLT
ncbi:hypothetical protein CathTA2_2215 [Caldalkalibacillus thermarum TA2.A1]|uniref:YqzM family protein n=1 Tax=Caldalkalibacillus thermarum (strain TA2.A1) TaxID=986075 RepID=F5L8R0_CALTT|nr:hypothetical protein CathTA2_2215 [Caldalkalibacillus thermarum TA2.A1]QZT33410.1 YqzM family protein [Caldalkalibacillus thermarum TA2.A1]